MSLSVVGWEIRSAPDDPACSTGDADGVAGRVVVAVGAAIVPLFVASSGAQVEPLVPARSFVAVLRHPGGSESVAWRAPEDLAVRLLSGTSMLGRVHAHHGTVVYRYSPRSEVSTFVRTFAAQPDAPPLLSPLLGSRDFALAQVRAGALKARAAPGGVWRVRFFAPPNTCAGFGSGTIELVLRRSDLLPVRVLERHGAVVPRNLTLTYRSVNGAVPAARFVAPGERVAFRADSRFVRSSPAVAAAHLSYVPLLPGWLPPGFSLSVSGWATRSATTGAEGSIPPMRQLFAAVYRRGSEELALTERLAPTGGWPGDPFGAECVRQFTETARVAGGATATYATSTLTTPHLYWRNGRLLYTLSGPFPKATLAAIARSLAPGS